MIFFNSIVFNICLSRLLIFSLPTHILPSTFGTLINLSEIFEILIQVSKSSQENFLYFLK